MMPCSPETGPDEVRVLWDLDLPPFLDSFWETDQSILSNNKTIVLVITFQQVLKL